MISLQHLAFAWATGLLTGFFISIPVGPISIAIIHEGGRKGFLWGLLIGLGAVSMEVVYCTISFAGFSSLFESRLIRAIMELVSFIMVLFLGIRYLFIRKLPPTPKTVEQIEEKFHPHTAFMTGFVRVLGNPAVLVYWITLSALFISHEWVAPVWPSKLACILGVAMGSAGWFGILSYVVAIGHRHLTDRALVKMEHFSGVFLLLIAVLIGYRLVMVLRAAPH